MRRGASDRWGQRDSFACAHAWFAHASGSECKWISRSSAEVAAVTALVLILFCSTRVYRLRNRISTSIGSALKRQVTSTMCVSMCCRGRDLPWKGCDLRTTRTLARNR